MNGPAQIETSSAPADALTPHQPSSHRARKARCERMRLRDISGVHNVTQIGTCEVLEARSALALAAAITSTASIVIVVAALDVIGKTPRSRPRPCIFDMSGRRATFQRRPGERTGLMDAPALPESFEYLVEALPIRMRCTEQRAKRRFKRGGPRRKRRSEYLERIPCFGETNLKTVVAQRAHKTCQPPARRFPDAVTGSVDRRN
jgi:hypothetical protein